MSHLTDEARAPYRRETTAAPDADSLEAIVAENPSRRSILLNGLLGLSAMPMLAACGDDTGEITPPTPTPGVAWLTLAPQTVA